MDLSSSSISTVLLSILRKMADNIWLRVAWKVNHFLAVVLPAPCDGSQTHLGRGLVDHVPAGEVDVVAGPHRVEKAGLVDLHMLRGQDGQ